jgi:predicted alpha/beta-fold hydrolase
MNDFKPPPLLRSTHIQSILASARLRRPLVTRRARGMLHCSRSHTLDCGDGIRLQGFYSGQSKPDKGLIVLIHGWEGGHDSLYLISAAGYLWQRGYAVFRLNLRDHGETHHLNRELFHSCRIDEVVAAVARINETFQPHRLLLGGFSLGGNFSLRVALLAPQGNIPIQRVVAVSPVLDPANTLEALENGLVIYKKYFLKKWRRSLFKKKHLFPDLFDLEELARHHTLTAMTAYFAEGHTPFGTMKAYLNGYTITGNRLADLKVPCHIISSLDDPVIPSVDLDKLALNGNLDLIVTRHGGHSGFIGDYRLNSWAERRMGELFDSNQ